ncbi:hypothetical protein B7Y94_02870 [Candidatus Saccharibacteria bacterium 32-49-12]|nr:MAG: hypothetical protein B7Y94_02870 [Candidatus Saccharibacteria bacterium 32-49-12]
MPPKGENPSDSLFTKIKTYSGEIKKFGKDFFVASLGAAALMGAACSPSGEASNEPSPDLPAATATATPGETATEPTETPTETSTSKPSATDSETTPSSKPSVVASETTSPTTAPSAPRETISPTEIESDIPEYLQGIDNINIDSVLEGTEFQKLSPEEQEKFRTQGIQ